MHRGPHMLVGFPLLHLGCQSQKSQHFLWYNLWGKGKRKCEKELGITRDRSWKGESEIENKKKLVNQVSLLFTWHNKCHNHHIERRYIPELGISPQYLFPETIPDLSSLPESEILIKQTFLGDKVQKSPPLVDAQSSAHACWLSTCSCLMLEPPL